MATLLQCRTLAAPARLDAILIAGSTASGKSALAAELARAHDGVVVNADSMQVYRDLRVLSARPSEADEAAIPHRLYGFVPAGTEYTVGAWLADAAPVLAAIRDEGRLAVIVGGTGLYFKALTQGLAETPAIPPSLRAALDVEPTAALRNRLAALDPAAVSRLSATDRPRLQRALEVALATGRTLADWQRTAAAAPLLQPGRWLGLFLDVPRDELARRIAARFHAMIEAGALDEMRALAKLGLPVNRGIMKAHGVPHLMAHLRGEIALGAAIERGIADTRRYAKRQATFARGQIAGFVFAGIDEARRLVADALTAPVGGPRWREDLDALEFVPEDHRGRCVIHRLALRKALGADPTPRDCLVFFEGERMRFEAAARAKIARAVLAPDAHFHLTSRDLSLGDARQVDPASDRL